MLAGAAVVALAAAARGQTTWYVDVNCPGPGSGTENDPFCAVQDAIDAAADSDEIVVAPGTYLETIDFLGKAVRLYSAQGPQVTTLDAQQAGTAVTCRSGEGADTVLEGFKITGGAADPAGGGMFIEGGSPTVTGCTFTGNTAVQCGGGMYNAGGSSPLVVSCRFEDNTAAEFLGGGMANDDSSPTVANCMFLGNAAVVGGGIGSDAASSPLVVNCTFKDNSAVDCTQIYSDGVTTVVNCIVWSSFTPLICIDAPGDAVTFSNVRFGYPGTGNIDTSPLWEDPGNDDLHLATYSPCIDAGKSTAVPPGVTTDLDGKARIADEFRAPDCPQDPGACGEPPLVDMGAYEYQPCPGDCNPTVDRDVNSRDLLALLAQWGREGTSCDFNGGGVGVQDVLIMLAHWGPCP
jgi:hypothetical protein